MNGFSLDDKNGRVLFNGDPVTHDVLNTMTTEQRRTFGRLSEATMEGTNDRQPIPNVNE